MFHHLYVKLYVKLYGYKYVMFNANKIYVMLCYIDNMLFMSPGSRVFMVFHVIPLTI